MAVLTLKRSIIFTILKNFSKIIRNPLSENGKWGIKLNGTRLIGFDVSAKVLRYIVKYVS